MKSDLIKKLPPQKHYLFPVYLLSILFSVYASASINSNQQNMAINQLIAGSSKGNNADLSKIVDFNFTKKNNVDFNFSKNINSELSFPETSTQLKKQKNKIASKSVNAIFPILFMIVGFTLGVYHQKRLKKNKD